LRLSPKTDPFLAITFDQRIKADRHSQNHAGSGNMRAMWGVRFASVVVLVAFVASCDGSNNTGSAKAHPRDPTTGLTPTTTTGHASTSKAIVTTASAVAALLGCSSTLQPITAVALGIAPADLFPKRAPGTATRVADALMHAETAKVQAGTRPNTRRWTHSV
jgi:hypothetical protein